MLDRYEFWHAAGAVLIVLLARREPRLAARLGARDWRLLIAGALLPLGDYLGAALLAPDSIEFLIRSRWLHSVLDGGLVIAAGGLLGAFLIGWRRALAGALVVALGWAFHLALDAVTEAGIWIGPAGGSARLDWPAFAAGHMPLVAALTLAWLAPRIWGGRAPFWRAGAWAITALYFGGGALQFAVVFQRAAGLARPGEAWDVTPADSWRAQWRLVLTDGGLYRVGELGPFGEPRDEPSPVPRWNDQPRLLGLLADPMVRRYYFQVFRHPVTQVDETSARITLMMREASDVDAGSPGATFTFETDLDGRDRLYRVERFD
jgi:hypothetical protein